MTAPKEESQWSRRDFMKSAFGSGAMVMLGQFGVLRLVYAQDKKENSLSMILVDYSRCTGCRTCETACSAFNNQQTVNGQTMNGLGNPDLANIRVYAYNPDVDIPAVCAMCPDTPCVEACPVEPDSKTGRKALFRDPENQTIKNDPTRCITCGSCAEACRTGVIIPDAETNRPEHMCTLCGGDPQCVKDCPFGALSHVKVDTKQKYYGMKPDQIAEKMIHEWYGDSK